MTTPIVDFVRQYAQSGTARLHMPGHKGQSLLGCEPWDITEIRGADELYEAEGIIAQSEANATRLFGTAHTYYSTEGSSQCIRAMLCLALQGAPRTGKRPVLLAARNAHKALLYAAALLDFDIRWLWPAPEDTGALCSCPVTAQALSAALEELAGQGRAPFGVYLTSPDYLGGMQDIAALSAVCDAHGVPLLVDNAHGAYLRFLPQNCHPIAQGAAMCCDSAHKTLPVVTGGAYLHLAHDAPCAGTKRLCGARWHCSALPAPLTSFCSRWMPATRCWQGTIPRRLVQCCVALEGLRRSLNKAAAARQCPVPLAVAGAQQEPMKLTLDAAALGCTGTALADALRRAQLECEYADPRYVVLMFTPGKPAAGLHAPASYAGTAFGCCACRAAPPREPGRRVCRLAAAGGAALYHPAGGAGRTGTHPGAQGTGAGVRYAHGVLPARHPCGGQRRGDHPGGHRPDAALWHRGTLGAAIKILQEENPEGLWTPAGSLYLFLNIRPGCGAHLPEVQLVLRAGAEDRAAAGGTLRRKAGAGCFSAFCPCAAGGIVAGTGVVQHQRAVVGVLYGGGALQKLLE